jgi:mannose-6-phosphate isomerase-like protein (cupin superfamily)
MYTFIFIQPVILTCHRQVPNGFHEGGDKMSLWPGHYLGKADTMRDPIVTEIPIKKLDLSLQPNSEVKSQTGTFYLFGKKGAIQTANAFIMVEQFGAGTSLTWMYPFDEFHYIIQGKARVTYTLSGTGHTEKKALDVETGDFIVTPVGSIVEFKIDPSGPLRRVCGVMPGVAMNAVQLAAWAKE